MSRYICSFLVALVLALSQLGAQGGDPAESQDVRCFVSAIAMLQTSDVAARNVALSSALYYLGRLDGRDPKLDLEKVVVEEFQRMTQSQKLSETERCGHELSSRGMMVSAIGKKLTQSGN